VAHRVVRLPSRIERAAYLAAQVTKRDGWVLAAPVGLNIVCFPFEPPAESGLDPDGLNREIAGAR